MSRGGHRPGAGRPAGSQNKRTQDLKELADRARDGGVSMLEMIVTTARDLWREANAGDRPNIGKRMQACMMAEKALPYLHPKLSQVQMNANVKRSLSDFDDAELATLAGEGSGEDGVAPPEDGAG
jgi:hypothetical protein